MSAVSSHRLVMVRKDCRRLRIYIGNPRLPDSNVLSMYHTLLALLKGIGVQGERRTCAVYIGWNSVHCP